MKTMNRFIFSLVLGVGLGLSSVEAADKTMPAGAPDAAQMQAMQKLMTPGENHHKLDPLVGKWTAKVSMWMAPNTKPQVSEGTSVNMWVLNNHFLQTTYGGTFNNQPFNGIGYMGYDNVRGEYQSMWLDNFGTGMMYGTGTEDLATKAIGSSGTFGCPMTGEKNRWYRTETKILGPDSYSYSSYGKGPDGKEFKGMEIIYTRTK